MTMEHITCTIIKRRTCSESHVYYVLTFQCKAPPFCYIKGYDNQRASICQNNKIISLKIKINEQLTIEHNMLI